MVNSSTLSNKSYSSKDTLKEQHWLHNGGDHVIFFFLIHGRCLPLNTKRFLKCDFKNYLRQ